MNLGNATSFKPNIKGVFHRKEALVNSKHHGTTLYFLCDFTPSTDPLKYQVTWCMDGAPQYVSDYGDSNTDPILKLTEKLFKKHGFRLGTEVRTFESAINYFFHSITRKRTQSADIRLFNIVENKTISKHTYNIDYNPNIISR